MNKPLPDKWIRKAIIDVANGMIVNSVAIPVYANRLPPDADANHFVLISTQTNTVNKDTKCGYAYESTVLLDIVTSFYGRGNILKKTIADDILDKLRDLTDDLQLDISSGLYINRQTQSFPTDITTITPTENIYRKFMRLEMFIN